MKEKEVEHWRYVPNFPEYVVSNLGNIHRAGQHSGRSLAQQRDKDGNVFVMLHVDDHYEPRRLRLDRIVAFAFLDAFSEKPRVIEVQHLDGDKTNCAASNLRWREE